MTATLHESSRPSAETDAIATGGAGRAERQRKSAPPRQQCVHTARIGVRVPRHVEPVNHQDDEAISNSLPSAGICSSVRAMIAASHEVARLAAALAFFCSRSSSRLAAARTSRLRV